MPADAYYGIQTARALENFPISGLRAPADLVDRHRPRQEGARPRPTSRSAVSTRDVGDAIVAAADEILAGALRDQFVVDVYQAGAGTSHNMNANEVLANRAAELLGGARGDLHARASQRPRQHGTVDQRRVPDRHAPGAAARRPRRWSPRRARWPTRSTRKADDVRRRAQGRPHAPAGRRADDARPGVRRLRRVRARAAPTTCEHAAEQLLELNLGATAVGTGLNAGDDFTRLAVGRARARDRTVAVVPAANRFRVTQSMGDVLAVLGRDAAARGRSSARSRAICGCSHGPARRHRRDRGCRRCSPARRSCRAR